MKWLNTRALGIIGIIGAPWLFIDFINNGLYDRFVLSSESGIRNFLFVTGWTCSVLGLYRIKAMGTKRWQKIVMVVQLVLLCIANCWSIWEIIDPHSTSNIYFIIGLSWPVMGFFMVVTGIVILNAKRLKGWKRYIPLITGLWFPLSVGVYALDPASITSMLLSGLSSAIVFSLLGLSLVIDNYEPALRRKSLL